MSWDRKVRKRYLIGIFIVLELVLIIGAFNKLPIPKGVLDRASDPWRWERYKPIDEKLLSIYDDSILGIRTAMYRAVMFRPSDAVLIEKAEKRFRERRQRASNKNYIVQRMQEALDKEEPDWNLYRQGLFASRKGMQGDQRLFELYSKALHAPRNEPMAASQAKALVDTLVELGWHNTSESVDLLYKCVFPAFWEAAPTTEWKLTYGEYKCDKILTLEKLRNTALYSLHFSNTALCVPVLEKVVENASTPNSTSDSANDFDNNIGNLASSLIQQAREREKFRLGISSPEQLFNPFNIRNIAIRVHSVNQYTKPTSY